MLQELFHLIFRYNNAPPLSLDIRGLVYSPSRSGSDYGLSAIYSLPNELLDQVHVLP